MCNSVEFWQTITATVTGGAITLIATILTNSAQKKIETDNKETRENRKGIHASYHY